MKNHDKISGMNKGLERICFLQTKDRFPSSVRFIITHQVFQNRYFT